MPSAEKTPLTTSQVAKRLNVTPRTVARWAELGHIKAFLLPNGHRRFDPAEVERLLTPEHDSNGDDEPSAA